MTWDLPSGSYLWRSNQDCTAFMTKTHGLQRWKALPMGFKNASAYFQREIDGPGRPAPDMLCRLHRRHLRIQLGLSGRPPPEGQSCTTCTSCHRLLRQPFQVLLCTKRGHFPWPPGVTRRDIRAGGQSEMHDGLPTSIDAHRAERLPRPDVLLQTVHTRICCHCSPPH